MKLNPFEKKLVQHPLRFWLQNHIEAPLLTSMMPKPTSMMPKPLVYIQQALEIGCGFGNGIHLIREHFGAEHVTAVDLDPEMVSAAKAYWRTTAHGLERLDFSVADATALPFKDAQFDTVFNFAVFHQSIRSRIDLTISNYCICFAKRGLRLYVTGICLI